MFVTLKFFVGLLRMMPHSFALAFGRFAGRVLRLILWKITDRCEARCVKSLGVGVTVARGIVRDSFVNLGMSAAEFIRLPRVISRIDELVDFPQESIDVLRSALSRGRGAILMCQHYGNWEYAAARVIHEGFPLHSVYTPQRDKRVEAVIMSTRQEVSHMAMIDSNTGLREIFRVLRAGKILVVMQDLDARQDGIPSEFLGLPARTHEGIVKLYRKFRCPVINAEYWRDMDDPSRHHIRLHGILSDMKDGNGKPFGEDISASIRMCNEHIERVIMRRPGQWLWLLDRWQYTLGKKI
ncbi:MAG: lysophospholipid acyltransferase family protein [Synergistaceae bacterium]|nr:lysophospholipid acyltransferase family protein [Synergistaceae bacterium]MBQ7169218.1 lysophospholipid acyltransferase family protein [Synergistaceae bacterium]